MPHHPRPIGFIGTVLIVVLALCLGACGEPDTSEDFGEVIVSAGQPIAVGVSVALTGEASGDAQAIERGVRLAVEQAGAVKGHPLAVEVRDDGCSAEGSVEVAREFGERVDVAGVVGPMCSRGCVPASLVYDDAKLLMLTPSCTASVLTGQVLDTVVRLAWNGEAAAIGGARFAAGELGAKRVYAVNDSTFYGKQQRDAFKETLKQRGGTLIADEYVQSQDWDFTTLVADIKAKAPDAIYYAGFLPAGRFLIQQVRYHGIAAPFIGADALLDVDAFIRESNTAARGAYLTDARSVEGKRYARFAQAYRERWGSDPGPWSGQAYDAAVVLIEALKKTADRRDGVLVVDRKALRDAVLETDRQGASGKIQFWPNGERKYEDAVVAVIKQADGDDFREVREYELD
jgi:ABC-type branched-subunit amino acid transport system substrate-binding protein